MKSGFALSTLFMAMVLGCGGIAGSHRVASDAGGSAGQEVPHAGGSDGGPGTGDALLGAEPPDGGPADTLLASDLPPAENREDSAQARDSVQVENRDTTAPEESRLQEETDIAIHPDGSDVAGAPEGGRQAETLATDFAERADAGDMTEDSKGDSAGEAAGITWIGKEMLGRPTDHSIAVKAVANEPIEAYVDYGTTAGATTASTAPATYGDGIVEAVISGLGPNTPYYYRLRYRPAGSTGTFAAGDEYTFSTQRSRGASFVFAIQSDSHLGHAAFNDPARYEVTMKNIAAAKPDFVLDLGDAVSMDDTTESEATARTKYLNQRAYFEVPGHSASIFLVLGNHEREEGWKLDDFGSNLAVSFPVLSANARKRYFVNPVPDAFYSGNADPMPELDGDHLRGDYYAFEWGDALFVAIDPFWYTTRRPYVGAIGGETDTAGEEIGTRWDWTLGQTQYLWLKQTLEQSDAPLKLVFAHQEAGGIDDYGRGGALGAKYCEFGGYDTDGKTWGWDGNRAGWDKPVHQLLVQNHVTAFFHGHDHVYAKEELDGVVYQEVPMAASPKNDTGFETNKTQYAGATLIENSGYLRVTVAATGATVEYVRSFLSAKEGENNSVAAHYTLSPYTPSATAGAAAQ